MSGATRSRDYRKRTTAIAAAKATVRGCFANLWLLVVFACLCGGVAPAAAQTAPSFTAPAAYNAQPGTVLVGVVTGVFNNSGGLLDFAVLEQVPNSGLYQVEIFHGRSDGTFCTNCIFTGSPANPDLIPLGPTVIGNAIAVGQFRGASGPLDIAVATTTGIVFLQNDGSGNFSLSSNAISAASGFASLAVGHFKGDSNYDIAGVTPAVSGVVSFTAFFGNGTGAFPTQSSAYAVSNTYSQCTAIMPGNFQSQTSGADLALLCNNPSLASVVVYLNSGSGAFTLNQTLSAGNSFGGSLPGFAVGTLNSQAAIFISPISSSFISYQGNGLAGVNNAFTSISMIPVGLAPRGSLAVFYNTPTGAIDFLSGPSISTYTSYTQSGTSLNGTWNSTASFGPAGQALATGFSPNLNQGGGAYVVVDASVHTGEFANFEPYVDERSIGVFLVTLNPDGTVATTNTPQVYSGTGANGYSAPPSFATGDFNGDGKMDLAVGGADLATGDATLKIYLANPDGTLPVPPTTSLPVVAVNNTNYSGADAVAAGKFRPPQNGKTLYDLAVFSFGQISIFTSKGNGTFGTGNAYSLSADPNYPGFSYNPSGGHPFAPVLTAADVNGDGMDDLVLALPEDNCIGSGSASQGAAYVLISNGDGTFKPPVFVPPPVVNPVSVTAANFFATGRQDLVFADGGEACSGNTATTKGTAVGILQNNVPANSTSINSSEFTPSAILTQSSDEGVPNITAVASADLDGDGYPDLVVSSADGIQVLLNQAPLGHAGTFSPTSQTTLMPLPLYDGDYPGVYCTGSYVGCVIYDSQLAIGSFSAIGENDVALSVAGVVYIWQNNTGLPGVLSSTAQGFVAGPDSTIMSAALVNSSGLSNLLVANSQGTAYLVNSGATGGPSFANYSNPGPIGFVTNANTVATQQLVLTNIGGTPFTISSISTSGIDSTFSVSNVVCNGVTDFPFSTPVNLGIAQSCTISLLFAPTAYGNGHADLLTILDTASNSNASPAPQNNGQSFLLTGDATEPFATLLPTALSFGSVNDGTAVTQTDTVTNTGNGPLTLQLALIGPLAGGFSYTQAVCNSVVEPSPTPFPITLSPGGSCTFTVQFDPTVAGPLSGTLGFADNAGVGESNLPSTSINGTSFQQIVSLSGTGVSVGPPPPVMVTDNETITVNDTFPDVFDTEPIHVTDTPIVRVVTPLTVTANNTTRAYGAANPNFTGTVTGALNGDSFVETFSTTAIASSPVGTYPIAPTVTGTDLIFYAVNAVNGTLNITQAGTSVQLSTSANGPVANGTPVVLTANAVSATTGTPTGAVTFFNGATSLGSGALSQGVATLTVSALPSGHDNITAQYGGDTNFTGSTSPVETVSVNSPDYTVSARWNNISPVSVSLAAGQQTNPPIVITVTPNLTYTGTVTFGCGNLPAYITCAFNPTSGSLTFGSGDTAAQSVSLTVAVASTIGMLQRTSPVLLAAAMPLGLLGFLPLMGENRKRLRLYLGIVALALAAAGTITGCTSAGSTTNLPPAGTQTIVVTTTGNGGIQHSLNLKINITN